jgi:hypothetical protein
VDEYRIAVRAEGPGEMLLREIEELLRQPIKDLLRNEGEPLPRLYLDWHLFNPILVEGGEDWREHVTVSPPPLVASERKLVEDLRSFWDETRDTSRYRGTEACLLRNLPKVGVGMFVRSGFYPDFILWIRNRKTKATRVVFLDPHGLHHEGVDQNDRFEAIRKLRALGKEASFRKKGISFDGYILAPAGTTPDSIPGAKAMTWPDLEKKFPLLLQDGTYVEKVFLSEMK